MTTGVILTSYLFLSAMSDWQERPDITTIELMTRPIAELTFPTVTVCSSRDTPNDPFSAIVRYLSPLKFQCGRGSIMVPEADCHETKMLRERFGFLFSFAFRTIEEEVNKIFDDGEESARIHSGLLNRVDRHAMVFEELLSMNTSYSKVAADLATKFGQTLYRDYLALLEEELQLPADLPPTIGVPSTSARKLAAMTLFSLRDLGSFGEFVSQLLPLMDPTRFSRRNTMYYKEGDCPVNEAKLLHELFANITSAIIWSQTGERPNSSSSMAKVSLFEVPDLVSLKFHHNSKSLTPSEHPDYASCYIASTPNHQCAYKMDRYLFTQNAIFDPCVQDPSLSCCDIPHLLHEDLETVMQIMRLSSHRAGDLEQLGQFVRVASFLGYPYFNVTEGVMRRDKKYIPQGKDPFAIIPVCEFVHQDGQRLTDFTGMVLPACTLFQPAVTDQGLCYSFNSPPLESLFKPSLFTSTFKSVFRDDFIENMTIFKAQPYDEDLGLTFLLDKQMGLRNIWNKTDFLDEGGFKIIFGEPTSMVSTRSHQRSVQIGHHTTFLLTPLVLTADEDLKKLSPEKRNCLFPDEGSRNLTLLQYYSQAGCFFECMIKHAREFCHCSPWDFPFTDNEPTKICNSYGYFCYNEIMRNTSHMSKYCNCLPDCNVVEYQVSESVAAVDLKKHCRRKAVSN